MQHIGGEGVAEKQSLLYVASRASHSDFPSPRPKARMHGNSFALDPFGESSKLPSSGESSRPNDRPPVVRAAGIHAHGTPLRRSTIAHQAGVAQASLSIKKSSSLRALYAASKKTTFARSFSLNLRRTSKSAAEEQQRKLREATYRAMLEHFQVRRVHPYECTAPLSPTSTSPDRGASSFGTDRDSVAQM